MRSVLIVTVLLVSRFGAQEALAAGGAIQLSSVRLTVEPRQRTAGVTLSNQTAEPQRYRVSVIDMMMDETGRIVKKDDKQVPHAHSARDWVIATPASISLDPGKSQKIRLLVRRPPGLTDGEYRVHLRVAQQPPADAAGGLRDDSSARGGLQFSITTVHATVLPVFVRHGQTQSSATIGGAHLLGDEGRMSLDLRRTGNASFRGFLRATAGDAEPVHVPFVIYPEQQQIRTSYDMGALARLGKPITVTLYEGTVPKVGAVPATAPLGSQTVTP